MKQSDLVTLENGISALKHEELVYGKKPTPEWNRGVQEGLGRAIHILENLAAANRKAQERPAFVKQSGTASPPPREPTETP